MVIIDEIDGALGGAGDNNFVKVLLDIVNAQPKSSAGVGEDGDGISRKQRKDRRGGGKAAMVRPLMRPIICICNDL